jgi:endonuclease/exonuclease/phosphatase family metal-dependent hydrolase
MRIKVITYNIHEGKTFFMRRDILVNILRELEREEADIVCLQEVMHGTLGAHAEEATFSLMSWPWCVYGKNSVLSRGCKGNAVLSRFPVTAWSNTDISIRKAESRGILLTEILPHGLDRRIAVVSLHFGLRPGERGYQTGRLIDIIKENVSERDALIIAGDFNDWQLNIHRVLEQELGVVSACFSMFGRHARTFPSMMPLLCLDHIYTRNCRLEHTAAGGAPFRRGKSDHIPLIAEVEIQDQGV